MHVVENNIDHPFDLTAGQIQLTARGCGLRCGTKQRDAKCRCAEKSLQ